MAEIKKDPVPAAAAPAIKPHPKGLMAAVSGLFLDSRNQINIKALNVILLAAGVALAARFGMIIDGSIKKMKAIDFAITSDTASELREKTVLRKVEYYLDKVKKRDIFRMGARPDAPDMGLSSKAVEATQNYRLAGISWSDDPDAMVEDIKAQKTFFVKKGQTISGGDITVEDITKDRVILRYGKDKVELR